MSKSNPRLLGWQTAERASTRLVARGTANEVPPAQQPRYAVPPGYYPHPPYGAVVFQQAPSMPQPPAKAPKRHAPETEDEAAGPKAKKAKSKKTVTDGAAANSMHHRCRPPHLDT